MSLGSGGGANLTGKLEDRGFYSSAPGGANLGWDHSLTQLALPTPLALDSNMLGLRSIFNNDLPPPPPPTSTNPPSSNSASNLFPLSPHQPPTSSLGLTSMSLLESVPPPPLGEAGKTFPPLFSMP